MSKRIADWYRHRPKKVTLPAPTVVIVEQGGAPRQWQAWRDERIAAMQVAPALLEGTFISRLQGDTVGSTLVLGFAEKMGDGQVYGVNLISKHPHAYAAGDHGTSPFIGRRCRVTIEVLDG